MKREAMNARAIDQARLVVGKEEWEIWHMAEYLTEWDVSRISPL